MEVKIEGWLFRCRGLKAHLISLDWIKYFDPSHTFYLEPVLCQSWELLLMFSEHVCYLSNTFCRRLWKRLNLVGFFLLYFNKPVQNHIRQDLKSLFQILLKLNLWRKHIVQFLTSTTNWSHNKSDWKHFVILFICLTSCDKI